MIDEHACRASAGPIRLFLSRVAAPEPIGTVNIVSDGRSLVGLDFGSVEARLGPLLARRFGPRVGLEDAEDSEGFGERIAAYFDGDLRAFDSIPIDGGGSPFQREVWAALRAIPPGETRSYGAIAARLGRPHAARSVGHANALNPISLVVPCHRLIGAAGALTGYGGGIERKRWLLDFEAASVGTRPSGEPHHVPGG